MPTPREVLRDYLPVVFDLIKTTSLVVIAASGIHLGYHVHEMTHEGVIWRDPLLILITAGIATDFLVSWQRWFTIF